MKYSWVPSSLLLSSFHLILQRHQFLHEWGKRYMLAVSWHLQKNIPKSCIWKNLFVPDEVFTLDETEVLIQQRGWDDSYKPLGYISPSKPTLLALEISNSYNTEMWFYPSITLIRNSRISMFHTRYIHHILSHPLWNIQRNPTNIPNGLDLTATSKSSNFVGACCAVPWLSRTK